MAEKWAARRMREGNYYIGRDEGLGPDTAYAWVRMASTDETEGDVMDRANAMAAAPDLLEALEGCVDSLEYVERNMPGATGYGVRQERITKARSVISKAKGG